MMLTRNTKGLTGLDLDAGSVAAVRIEANGRARVTASAVQPLAPGVFREGEVVDGDALTENLRELFAKSGLPKNVRIGVANPKIAVRTLRLPLIERDDELETAVRFQAQDHIPMPLDQTVLEHRVVNRLTNEQGDRRMDVVVVAARRDMIASVLEPVRKAGLRPVGVDLSAFGMIRALCREPESNGGGNHLGIEMADVGSGDEGSPAAVVDAESVRLYCNFGDVTNLAVARGALCEFTRISPFGFEGIAQRLAEKRGLTLEHARQWLGHVGLESPEDEIEGDPEVVSAAREVLVEGSAKLADELRLSLEYYGAQEGAGAIHAVVACGPGAIIPGLVARLQRELGLAFQVGRPAALHGLPEGTAARLTLPYGLALEA